MSVVDHDILMYAFDYALYNKTPTPMVILDAVKHNINKLSLYEFDTMCKKIVYAERLQFDYNGSLLSDESLKNVWIELRMYLEEVIMKHEQSLQKSKRKTEKQVK